MGSSPVDRIADNLGSDLKLEDDIVEGPWMILAYVMLVGFLPAAFWYALWPYRRRLLPKTPANNRSGNNELVPEEVATGEG